jgi:hypothetical protein
LLKKEIETKNLTGMSGASHERRKASKIKTMNK